MLTSLLKKPSKKVLLKVRKEWQASEAETAKLVAIRPEHALAYRKVDLYTFATNAVSSIDESLLDEITTEFEAIAPDDIQLKNHIRLNRALIWVRQHKFKEAIALMEELVVEEICMNRSNAWINLIELYAKLKDYKNAARWVHVFLEDWKIEHKQTGDYFNFMGLPYMLSILAEAGEYENVIRYGKASINRHPREAYMYFLVGQSYLEMKDDLRALQYFTKVQKLRPNKYPTMYQNLGGFYWNEHNDFHKAIEYTLKAAEICGDDPKYKQTRILIHQNMAMFYKAAHDLDKAGEHRRKQFEAMGSLELFDLVVLFGGDKETMNEFEVWAENHPEIYDKFFEEDEDEEGEEI